jgi:hypothetical protein
MFSALKKLSKEPLTGDHAGPLIKEIDEGSPRSAVLIGGALVENALHTLILSRTVKLTSSEKDSLFGGYKPLSSFSAIISVGYAFGCFGPKTRDDLELTRLLRNTFAHTPQVIDFETPEVSDATKRFNSIRNAAASAEWPSRKRYSMGIHGLALHIFALIDRNKAKMLIALD